MTSSFDSALCGAHTYTATYEGSPITESSSPVAYDPSTKEFTVFADDIGLVGPKTITISGFYEEHTSNSAEISF